MQVNIPYMDPMGVETFCCWDTFVKLNDYTHVDFDPTCWFQCFNFNRSSFSIYSVPWKINITTAIVVQGDWNTSIYQSGEPNHTCAAGTYFTRSRRPSTISCTERCFGFWMIGWCLDAIHQSFKSRIIMRIHQFMDNIHGSSVAFDILFHPNMMNSESSSEFI